MTRIIFHRVGGDRVVVAEEGKDPAVDGVSYRGIHDRAVLHRLEVDPRRGISDHGPIDRCEGHVDEEHPGGGV